tara:strand:+ start:1398 stop:1979 length:582 start_codon:yes stop_codon:yes gene_type:complete
MNKLIFATQNINKVREVRELLSNSFEILGLDDIGFNEDIIEDKSTIIENSIKKAEFIKIKTGYDCFADDTGLEVNALNGQPGVFSKRFAGPNASSDDNIDKLLEMLGNNPNRAARFKTVISLSKNSEIITFEGLCEGNIGYKRMGNLGFGYDPVFIPKNRNISFGQMSLSEKNLIAHRAKAMNKLVDYLTNLY